MAWAKFDDRWATHPKLLAAGLEAKGLDASGICYAAGQETDGFVPDTALIILAAGHRNVIKVAQRLVDVGRWVRDDSRKGYVIHDFDVYNFTRAQGEDKRKKAAERKAAYRAKQGRDAQGRITSGDQDADVRADTDDCPDGQYDLSPWDTDRSPMGTVGGVPPVPTRPDPTRTTNQSSSSLDRAGPASVDDDERRRAAQARSVIAERRIAASAVPISNPRAYRSTVLRDVEAQHGPELARLAGEGLAAEAIADAVEPVEVPMPPASPYPLAGEHLPPSWDLDDSGLAVPKSVSA